jgi:hypothetical protein
VPPQPEKLRGFWPGAWLPVGQRPQRVFSLLPPVRLGPTAHPAKIHPPRRTIRVTEVLHEMLSCNLSQFLVEVGFTLKSYPW